MSGWISVSERLPDDGVVLVSDGLEYATARRCDVSAWNPEGITSWDADLSFEPTHWQPLPEPPCT